MGLEKLGEVFRCESAECFVKVYEYDFFVTYVWAKELEEVTAEAIVSEGDVVVGVFCC